MHENAFINKPGRPSDTELARALGPAKSLWDRIIASAKEMDVHDEEWKSYSPKYGWTLRLKQKKRTIVYLSPAAGYFLASLILGDRALKAARESGLSKGALKVIDSATRYPEGTAIRIAVKKQPDVKTVEKFMTFKVAP